MVTGLTYQDAAECLRHAGYQPAATTAPGTPAQPGTATLHATVIAQQPAPGIPSNAGITVTLTISTARTGHHQEQVTGTWRCEDV